LNGQRLILISRDDRNAGPHNTRLDNAAAARLAFAAFIRAGCRTIAVINSNIGTPSLSARVEILAKMIWRSSVRV
jgi:DNA-binding LacI/PurR family transcriptional regulator